MNTIVAEIAKEREYQNGKWGTTFDDKNTINDWVTYINQYAGASAKIGLTKAQQRLQLLKTAALAVAALETFDRNNGFPARHYDTV